MFVTTEDCEICPAVGPQFITEVLGFEDRKLGFFFPPAKKKKTPWYLFHLSDKGLEKTVSNKLIQIRKKCITLAG